MEKFKWRKKCVWNVVHFSMLSTLYFIVLAPHFERCLWNFVFSLFVNKMYWVSILFYRIFLNCQRFGWYWKPFEWKRKQAILGSAWIHKSTFDYLPQIINIQYNIVQVEWSDWNQRRKPLIQNNVYFAAVSLQKLQRMSTEFCFINSSWMYLLDRVVENCTWIDAFQQKIAMICMYWRRICR